MARLGTRLGLHPPKDDKVTPAHLCAPELNALPNDFSYIGQGNVNWRLAPGYLSRAPSESIEQYRDRILSSSKAQVQDLTRRL